MSSEKIWYEDFPSLITKQRLLRFFPTNDQNTIQKTNSIFQLSVYSTILVFFLTGSPNAIFIVLIAAIASVFVSKHQIKKFEEFFQQSCRMPSKDNPLMNKLPMSGDPREPCDPNLQHVHDEVVRNFNDTSGPDHIHIISDLNESLNNRLNTGRFYTAPVNDTKNAHQKYLHFMGQSVIEKPRQVYPGFDNIHSDNKSQISSSNFDPSPAN